MNYAISLFVTALILLTGIVLFSRVEKSDPRLIAYADCDEANAALGVAVALGKPDATSHVTFSDNRNPQLAWTGAPEGTQSFVVTAYDPDAPTGSGWWHWTVFDIPAAVTELPAGATVGAGLPAGAVEGRTDFGAPGYGGACPPPGAPHHYVFTVFALGVADLPLDDGASGAMVGFMARANALASATLTATYGR